MNAPAHPSMLVLGESPVSVAEIRTIGAAIVDLLLDKQLIIESRGQSCRVSLRSFDESCRCCFFWEPPVVGALRYLQDSVRDYVMEIHVSRDALTCSFFGYGLEGAKLLRSADPRCNLPAVLDEWFHDFQARAGFSHLANFVGVDGARK